MLQQSDMSILELFESFVCLNLSGIIRFLDLTNSFIFVFLWISLESFVLANFGICGFLDLRMWRRWLSSASLPVIKSPLSRTLFAH